MAGKTETVIERHHVDAEAEQRPGRRPRRRHHGAGPPVDSAGAADPNESAAMSGRPPRATVMPGCSASRSGNTFEAIPGDAPRVRRSAPHRHADHHVVGAGRRCRNTAVAAVMTRASVVRLRAANARSASRTNPARHAVARRKPPGLLDGRLLSVRLPGSGRAAKALTPIAPVVVELIGRAIRRVLVQQAAREPNASPCAHPPP